MSALKDELTGLINSIPDEKLAAIKPLLAMIYEDTVIIEPIFFDDLEEDEKEAITKAKSEDAHGETFAHEEIDWDNIESMNLD